MSLSVTYSSKVKLNSSLSKKIVLSFGEALISTGGKESLGPPVGEALLAHCTVVNKSPPKRRIFKPNLIIRIYPQNKAIFYLQPTSKYCDADFYFGIF